MKKLTLAFFFLGSNLLAQTISALPPPEDIPEEILRTEIILEGRSPIDNRPLSAAEYAQEQEKIAQSPNDPELDPKVRELIFLLRLRKLIKTITPF